MIFYGWIFIAALTVILVILEVREHLRVAEQSWRGRGRPKQTTRPQNFN